MVNTRLPSDLRRPRTSSRRHFAYKPRVPWCAGGCFITDIFLKKTTRFNADASDLSELKIQQARQRFSDAVMAALQLSG
jgi:hypothetical protein